MEEDKEESLEKELTAFRQRWQNELQAEKCKAKDSTTSGRKEKTINVSNEKENIEEKAAKLFLEGVQWERKGQFDAAVYFYRQAVRLVPDIEFKIAEHQVTSTGYLSDDSENETENDEDDQRYSLEPVCQQIEDLSLTGLCCPAVPQKETHISKLPTELLMVIFRWVVSKDLDVITLERMAQVCKWFYACARDQELWKSICIRVWGIYCAQTVGMKQLQWRKMFMERPHLKYSGVYISVNTYVRVGEQGLDSFYKPCHLIEYYKYLRFFTDGTVLIYTSADELQTSISLLNRPPYRDPAVYKGYYRVAADQTVNIFYTRVTKPSNVDTRRRKQRGVIDPSMDVKEYNFSMQLILKDTRKKRNNQLLWNNYSYKIKNRRTGEVGSENTINSNEFKPFVYSPVKSYCSKSFDML